MVKILQIVYGLMKIAIGGVAIVNWWVQMENSKLTVLVYVTFDVQLIRESKSPLN